MYEELESREGKEMLGPGKFPPFKSNLAMIMEEEIYFLIVETPRSAGQIVRLLWAICLVTPEHERTVKRYASPRQRSLKAPTNTGLSLTSGYPIRRFFTVRQCRGIDIRVLRYGIFESVRWIWKEMG
jgi:hypothetical protein